MKKIRIIRNSDNKVTHSAILENDKAFDWIAEHNVKDSAWGEPGTYTIDVEDITKEIQDKEKKEKKNKEEREKTLLLLKTDLDGFDLLDSNQKINILKSVLIFLCANEGLLDDDSSN